MAVHADTQCDAVTGITAEITRSAAGEVSLSYELAGRIAALALPAPTTPSRRDALWQHTCFELFVDMAGEGYREFNFAPSGQWAAYGFSGYRIGMHDVDIDAPQIAMRASDELLELNVTLAPGIGAGAIRIGISAVIEEADGRKSYWALAHPSDKADFHHPDCFAFELPALELP
ncbi:hypothetical protein D3876_14520 [Sphingomonas cavernae]|uniref:DOMON-like domain-containing protein n=1 Tax=Sphingomonas cavernae TaxID=2320861 RepID=A0A418WMU5_9SPHN|nr:hypothetical protein D3876_14520 [Sphingomonas cavernae]